jgi:hypothetical protein
MYDKRSLQLWCQEYSLLGYNAVWSVEGESTFRRNIYLAVLATCCHAGLLF